MQKSIAIIGTGLIGQGWAIVFAQAGYSVRLHDFKEGQTNLAISQITQNLEDMMQCGLVISSQEILDRIIICPTLETAVKGVIYVQESVYEEVDIKNKITQALDKVCEPKIIIGSSSSGIPSSAFTHNVLGRDRCLIAHPVNPPYLVKLVEIVPAPWTKPENVDKVYQLMKEVGQEPIRVDREIDGFILNRLQGVLLNEAWALFEEGYATTEDIDKTISEGLGTRWSFMGPFETIDLNAPHGVSDYAARLKSLYHDIALSRTAPKQWSQKLIKDVDTEMRKKLNVKNIIDRQRWRDRKLMQQLAFKKNQSNLKE
ncbi:MAG: 3-hydroxyacyl-CoA dehydrogenase [Rhodospirillaceae bacterium]|nr:3-hydroxyacyl-CoA dehydrogenase [Rhodospirillaceae bacterium]|tara:strand:+ start:224 stop:1165 length:942 start_codon:yes stop_codon:yes gene_type:complete